LYYAHSEKISRRCTSEYISYKLRRGVHEGTLVTSTLFALVDRRSSTTTTAVNNGQLRQTLIVISHEKERNTGVKMYALG